MSEKIKFGNTIVSSRADQTLTYTRYVRDEATGKSAQEQIDGINKDFSETKENAEKATANANKATEESKKATEEAKKATSSTTEAVENAKAATEKAVAATGTANEAAGKANTATDNANKATTAANNAASAANESKENADAATSEANKQAAISEELNSHPNIIKDGYWWTWNLSTHKYMKTDQVAVGTVDFPTFFIDEEEKTLKANITQGTDADRFALDEDGSLRIKMNYRFTD